VRGWPDYTNVTALVDNYDEFGQNYPVGGGDIAARLGSIKTYDMRGRVYWMDDFEAAVLKWKTFGLGAGGSQALTTDYARNGNQSVKLTSNIGPPNISSIRHEIALPRNVKMGFEVHISMAAGFNLMDIEALLADGSTISHATVRIDEVTNQLLYLDEHDIFVDTGLDLCLSTYEDHFHAIKLVWDYETDEWLRIMYDHQELNLHRAAMRNNAWFFWPAATLSISNYGDNVNNVPVYVDDAILTVMEPE